MLDYPFRVEVVHEEGEAVVLAEVARPGVAYACYQAAMKAYPDKPIVLYGDGRVLAKSGLSPTAS
jgi:hypothetical protein